MSLKTAIIDERVDAGVRESLGHEGFSVIELPPYAGLSEAVCSHTDMLITRLGDELITLEDYRRAYPSLLSDIQERCRNAGLTLSFTDEEVMPSYPYDARLNVLTMGKYLFCKTDTVSSFLLKRAEALGFITVHVNQGYPACTVLKLDECHAITADVGMKRALESCGTKVTLIESGSIDLPPHPYGFIGGAAGVYGDTVYFIGDPATHPSYDRIDEAISTLGLGRCALSSGRLTDLGGILFIDGTLK